MTPEDLPTVCLLVAKLDNCLQIVQVSVDRYAFALVGQVEGFEKVEVEWTRVADGSGERAKVHLGSHGMLGESFASVLGEAIEWTSRGSFSSVFRSAEPEGIFLPGEPQAVISEK